MTLSPVTLQEFREHLNLDATDTTTSDEELWTTLLAAVGLVESRAGAMRIRTVTERVHLGHPYRGAMWEDWPLSQWPVYGDAMPTAVAVTGGRPYTYDVTYTVGRNPVPDNMLQATLIIARQLYDTQRNAAAVTFTNMGGQETLPPMGFAVPRRAEQLLSDYVVPAIA